jgi:hypothetical protein
LDLEPNSLTANKSGADIPHSKAMTNLDTQTLVALLCVLIAAAVLCRRTILWWRGRPSGCGGGCHGCGSEPTRLKVPLTVLSPPDERMSSQRMENEK